MIIPTPLIKWLSRTVLGWLDERTEAPIMRQRVNAGSDRYFRHAQLTKGESELDEILGGRTADDEDEDELSAAQLVAEEYVAARRALVISEIVLPISAIYLFGAHGLGPLGGILSRMPSRRLTILIGAGILCAVSSVQLVRFGIRTFRLRKELDTLRRDAKLPRNSDVPAV